MRILLFSKNKESREIVAFALESHLDVQVVRASDLQGAIEILLDEKSIDLIICEYGARNDHLIKFIASVDAQIPVLFIVASPQIQIDTFPDLNILGKLSLKEVPEKLLAVIRSRKKSFEVEDQTAEYCPIKTELLLRVGPLKGDIYVKLSSIKYVMLFREGQAFTEEHLDRILFSKKVEYLYIKQRSVPEFIEKLKAELSKMADEETIQHTPSEAVTSVLETVHELVHRIGFTKEVQAVAKENVRLALASIGSDPQLSQVLSAISPEHRNYISSHSVMLASIANCIAAKMEWPSKLTFHKLTLAAFFHDIALTNQALAATHNLNTAAAEGFTASDLQEFKEHPSKAAQLVMKMNEMPAEVDVIVAQHHERPDGSGFPKGLTGARIAPLTAVFIVAHDIVHAIREHKGRFQLAEFVRNHQEIYSHGTFKKIWDALAKSS